MLSLTIAIIVINLSIGITPLLQARRDIGAITFFLITFVFSLLSLANYLSLTKDMSVALYWIRIEMLLAAWHTFLFFVFVHVFTKQAILYAWKRIVLHVFLFLVIVLISSSSYLFSGIIANEASGELELLPGMLFPVFAIWLLAVITLSLKKLVRMYQESEGAQRKQWKFLLLGSSMTYSMLIIFNFIFAGIFHISFFLKYTPLFSLPIIVATAYAIIKHNLFNMKVLATQAFVYIISTVYLAKIFISVNMLDRIVDSTIFLATVFFGVLLVRSIKEEVRAREEVRDLAKRLTETNWQLAKTNEQLRIIDQRKSEFVSIVSHQLRTPITAIKGYASLVLEGSYGILPKEIKGPIEKIFISSKRLASMVTDFLDVSKIEQGTMTYNFSSVDVKTMLSDLITEFISFADKKGLTLDFSAPDKGDFVVTADEGKIRQIFSNLIDNGIKYTPKGMVLVTLEKDNARGVITVKFKDSGIGLSQDDIQHLFGKFTRGSQGQRENTDGSGLGLYVAKKMLEAQHGKMWVDSEGTGKGATFVVELLAEET